MNHQIINSVLEQMTNPLPDYHNTMYLEGYKPYEILQSASRTLYKQILDNQSRIKAQDEEKTDPTRLDVSGEVFLNGKRI